MAKENTQTNELENKTSEPKRYYWLKLHSNFFSSLEVKAMSKQGDGAPMIVCYLKMLLHSLPDGNLLHEGVCDDLADEIAIAIDEPPELVRQTLEFCKKKKIADDIERLAACEAIFMNRLDSMIGSESQSAPRVRRFRERQKQIALQSNSDVTGSNDIKRREGRTIAKPESELKPDLYLDEEKVYRKEESVRGENRDISVADIGNGSSLGQAHKGESLAGYGVGSSYAAVNQNGDTVDIPTADGFYPANVSAIARTMQEPPGVTRVSLIAIANHLNAHPDKKFTTAEAPTKVHSLLMHNRFRKEH